MKEIQIITSTYEGNKLVIDTSTFIVGKNVEIDYDKIAKSIDLNYRSIGLKRDVYFKS